MEKRWLIYQVCISELTVLKAKSSSHVDQLFLCHGGSFWFSCDTLNASMIVGIQSKFYGFSVTAPRSFETLASQNTPQWKNFTIIALELSSHGAMTMCFGNTRSFPKVGLSCSAFKQFILRFKCPVVFPCCYLR